MAATCMKRLVRERERLPTDSTEYFVNFKDSNLKSFQAYIVGPEDSIYRYKLIRLQFEIPDNYPLVPPKVKFIQHSGDRIHPNLYTEGKVCLSILGTWPGDPWSYSMTIESVLITIRSLLDNKPYMHEPHQGDRPEFNRYVKYNTWRWLLLDYLEREQDPEAKEFLRRFVENHGNDMIKELEHQKSLDAHNDPLTSPYSRRTHIKPDYDRLLVDLKFHVFRSKVCALGEMSAASESLQIDQRKRKAPEDALNSQQPTQKRKQEPYVIDLTDDP